MRGPPAVLFDLDGTLVDSAPDLAGAANEMRAARGLPTLQYADLRRHASSGARGMLGAAFGLSPHDDAYETLRREFLDRYERRMLDGCRVFDAVLPVLGVLEGSAVSWGIVTNKAHRMAQPLAQALGLWPRTRVLVAGDTTPYTKPHPEPLLEAARRLGRAPRECVYVGDDLRDIEAGRAAGMRSFAAAWGYLGDGAAVEHWGADAVLTTPSALLQFLELP